MTVRERIRSFLALYPGRSYTDAQIAAGLNLPTPSVRRTRNEMEGAGEVQMDGTKPGRVLHFMLAENSTDGLTGHDVDDEADYNDSDDFGDDDMAVE